MASNPSNRGDDEKGSFDSFERFRDEGATPVYHSNNEGEEGLARRSERRGPLSARISQRQRDSGPPATEPRYEHFMRSPYEGLASQASAASATPTYNGGASAYAPPAQRNTDSTSWEKVTGSLRLDERVNDTLFEHGPEFGATWNSRAEMLRACLDEYYRVISNFNDTRRLLEISESDLEPLRREQATAALRVRDAEARIEFQSRIELRAVYLGAAEIEARLFRAEQEHNLLSNRLELLDGFMMFLSRIIATVRAMPEDTLLTDLSAAADPLAGSEEAEVTNLQETITYEAARARLAALQEAETQLMSQDAITAAYKIGPNGSREAEIEELIVDESDVPLLASGEFEIVEIVDGEPAVGQAAGEPPVSAPVTKQIPPLSEAIEASKATDETAVSGRASADVSLDPTQKLE